MPQIGKVGTKTSVGWRCSQTTPLSLNVLYNNIVLQAIGSMGIRNYTTTDVLFLIADDALTTIYGKPRATDRPNPGAQVTQKPLSASEKAQSVKLMRVNHCGEVCAQALYRSQALTARSATTKKHMINAAREENDHLQWCQERIHTLGGKKSLLDPAWYAGSFLIGAVVGLMGDRWSLGFLAETERQVEKHLETHLNRLPRNDEASRTILVQMKKDEVAHATTAIKKGGAELPNVIKQIMKLGSSLMTTTSQWI